MELGFLIILILGIGLAMALDGMGRGGPVMTYDEAQFLSKCAETTFDQKNTPCTKCGGTDIGQSPIYYLHLRQAPDGLANFVDEPYECADCGELHGITTHPSSQYAHSKYHLANEDERHSFARKVEHMLCDDKLRKNYERQKAERKQSFENARIRQTILDQTRPAGLADYALWLKKHLENGGRISHFYDYPWSRWEWRVASGASLELQPFQGSSNLEIIVPEGVTVHGDPGRAELFLINGRGPDWRIPIFSDPELLWLVEGREDVEALIKMADKERRGWDSHLRRHRHA